MPDVEAARRWFDEVAFSYPEPRPASGDPDQIKAWNSRGLGWARTVDLEGFDTALTAVMEEDQEPHRHPVGGIPVGVAITPCHR